MQKTKNIHKTSIAMGHITPRVLTVGMKKFNSDKYVEKSFFVGKNFANKNWKKIILTED